MTTIIESAASIWESYLGKLTILAAIFGSIPFYFLSHAMATLGN